MKRLLALLLAICMSFSIVLTVACDGESHTHNWSDWLSNEDGTHTRVCVDDSTHTETEDCVGTDICSKCGGEITVEPNPNPEPDPDPQPGPDIQAETPYYIEPGTYNKKEAGRTEIKVVNFNGYWFCVD